MKTEQVKGMQEKQTYGFSGKQESAKISLKATKVHVQKRGMNSGISGGSSQCC